MNNFFKRLLTAIFFTATLLGCILYNEYSFFILFFIIALLTLREFYTHIALENIRPQWFTGVVGAASIMLTTGLFLAQLIRPEWLIVNFPVLFLAFIYELYTKAEKPFSNIAFTLFGVFYIAVPFALLLVIPFLSGENNLYHPHLVFGYFLLLWAGDTGAYLSGMAFGKHRLFERISPKKSWEGFVGGAVLNLFTAWCCAQWFPELGYMNWTIMGLLIIITGTFGDLAESLLKRSLNIKDSGNILPGHGGLLDRFDALLVSVPFVTAFLVLVKGF